MKNWPVLFFIENSLFFVKHPVGMHWPITLEDLNCCVMKNWTKFECLVWMCESQITYSQILSVFPSDWMVPLYVRRRGGGAVKLWDHKSSNQIAFWSAVLWEDSLVSMATPYGSLFAGTIFYNEYLYFCLLSSCTNMLFFPLFWNVCVISVKKTARSLFVLSVGRRKLWTEQNLKWPKDKHGFKFVQ